MIWKLSESPGTTTVVTANGEVQTNEEAQVYVHDLDIFVTVQILDDTLAVLSFGKLCEKNGYTNEWASGQKLHLTKNGKRVLCETESSNIAGGIVKQCARNEINKQFTVDGRNADITVDLVLQARAKMSDNRVNGPEDKVVSEMIRQLPSVKISIHHYEKFSWSDGSSKLKEDCGTGVFTQYKNIGIPC